MQMLVPAHAQVLIPGAVALVPKWLSDDDADLLHALISIETSPLMRTQLAYGNGRPQWDGGHKMARFGDEGVSYSYRGKAKPMHAMPKTLDDVRHRIAAFLGWRANCCVVNTYAPKSGLYPHSDGKYIPELGVEPVIVSVSFGATRSFILHPFDGKKRSTDVINVPLSHGDLMVMHGRCDSGFHHSITAEPNALGDRLSLTFRLHNQVQSSTA